MMKTIEIKFAESKGKIQTGVFTKMFGFSWASLGKIKRRGNAIKMELTLIPKVRRTKNETSRKNRSN